MAGHVEASVRPECDRLPAHKSAVQASAIMASRSMTFVPWRVQRIARALSLRAMIQ